MNITSRIARATAAGSLVLAGFAVGITGVSNAQEDGAAEDGTSEQRGPEGPGGHGPRAERVDDATFASITEAVEAEYPEAVVMRAGATDDGYIALIQTAAGDMVALELDDSFAITETREDLPERPDRGGEDGDERERPSRVDDATLASITEAVQAEYPGSDVKMAGALEDGTYRALVVTADDEAIGVVLDSSFAITETREDLRPHGRHGGPGGERPEAVTDEATLASITEAVQAEYPGATVERAGEFGDGYGALVTTADDEKVGVRLNADFEITDTHEGVGERRGGPGGPGGRFGDRDGADDSEPEAENSNTSVV